MQRKGSQRRRGGARREAGGYRRVALGTLLHRTATGHLLVRVEHKLERPVLGVRVVDEAGSEVGILADVIGPVDRPFIVVKPSPNAATISAGAQLFALIPTGKGRGGKSKPRVSGRRMKRGGDSRRGDGRGRA